MPHLDPVRLRPPVGTELINHKQCELGDRPFMTVLLVVRPGAPSSDALVPNSFLLLPFFLFSLLLDLGVVISIEHAREHPHTTHAKSQTETRSGQSEPRIMWKNAT